MASFSYCTLIEFGCLAVKAVKSDCMFAIDKVDSCGSLIADDSKGEGKPMIGSR
jgi:hypothetical protein